MLRRRVAGPRPLRPTLSSGTCFLSASNGQGCGSCGACVASYTATQCPSAAAACGGSSGLFGRTSALLYMYRPPDTHNTETSRLPWYHRASLPAVTTTTNTSTSASATAPAPQSPSALHLQEISSILQSTSTGKAPPAAGAAVTTSSSANSSAQSSHDVSSAGVRTPAPAPQQGTAPGPYAATPSFPLAATAAAAVAAAQAATMSTTAAAALRRGDRGALRLTPARRMSALSGPTLDVRVEDIVKVEETLASELTLPKVVQLLIDPQAEGVERITMSEFAAMQPKRQLLAVGGKKEWLQWIEQSTYYQQATRLSAESPAQDLAALQQAGIYALQQWLEQPQLVRVSARTRSALDTAVAQSVEAYMSEVAQVVNTSNAVEDVLTHWVSDVMGKFILDSLQIPLDRASQAMWSARREWMPADVVRNGGAGGVTGSNGSSAASLADVAGGGAPQNAESRLLNEMLSSSSSSNGASGSSAAQQQQQQPVLRPGEACTLTHYLRFVQKVMSSVRQDYVANHAAMGHGTGRRGDEQAEQEIAERSHGVIAAALTQLLEKAALHQLPPELQTLQQNGYLALDRVPGLLKRAGNLLQLRAVPVRFFVFHSSADDDAAAAAAAASAARGGGSSGSGGSARADDAATGLSVPAPPFYPPGTFLTGSNQLDVTLGEWTGRPDPPSSTAREVGGVVDDATEQEYLSMLRRLRRRVDTLAVTSLYEVVGQPDRYGGHGFSAVEAIGLHQLFGPVKLLEDRLTTTLHYPVAAADKPIHFVEAGPLSGKTALLEQLAERTARPGDKVAVVRYSGSATPYLPDVDDHPVAFASRFWFRVALASCPYLIRVEELYSRAPRSVYWWGHEKNWSWERYQSLLQSARNAGAGHRQHQQQRGGLPAAPAQLATVLVDDVDRALGAMQLKWGDAAALSAAAAAQTSQGVLLGGSGAASGPAAVVAAQKAQQAQDDVDDEEEENGDGSNSSGHRSSASLLAAAAAAVPSPSLEQQRQQVISLWRSTGKSVEEHLASCFTQLSAAVGQVNIVFTGTAVAPLLLTHCAAPCRRYYLPLSGGVGLQSRLRVLPLLATLHAMHLTHHLDMPGLLYEVLKNCPALTGKALELFWSHRVSTMDLRTGLPRLTMGSGSAHPQLIQSYVPRELFAELPLYTTLLQNPRRTRRRLVELLQRQLSSPTGYLSTELDTTPQDVKDGLVLPHNLTSCQVHPFALFAIFSRQDAIDARVFNGEGQLLDGSEVAADKGDGEEDETENADKTDPGNSSSGSNNGLSDAAAAARVRSSTGVGSNERKVVRAWAEVWAEYRSVVSSLSTSPTRKRDAMRVLLHGALLLRSAAVAGAQLELNLKVPSYGFPLLASETRGRSSSSGGGSSNHQHHQRGDALIRPATPETVRRATAAYKMFFSNAAPSHFPFRPMVGLNGGCDVVFVCGSTLALYDIVTTAAQLRHMVGRLAEALLGVLHVLERQVFPLEKVRAVQCVTVVSLDEPRPGVADVGGANGGVSGGSNSGGVYGRRRAAVSPSSAASTAGGLSVDVFNNSTALTVPFYLDYGAVFEDHVLDRLRALQQTLGITKDFRTLSELIDELERTHRVRVTQDVVSTPEEVESLFSPTLLQLVPDATVLPAYTSAVVSAEELMMQAMKGRSSSSGKASGSSIGSGNGGVGTSATGGAAAAALVNGASRHSAEESMSLNIDDDDDDDDDADYVNLGEEEVIPGAELDDVASDVRLSRDGSSKNDLRVADHEHLHESAELLEAIMNDNLDIMSNSTARLQEQREETARDLRRDLVMEDRINYNAPAPSTTAAATSSSDAASSFAASSNSPAQAAAQKRAVGPGRSAAEDAEADALAWLHDIISPESLIAGLKGTAPGAGTPFSNVISTPAGALAGGSSLVQGLSSQATQQYQQQQTSSPTLPSSAQQQHASPLAAGTSPMMPNPMGPWTPNVAAPDGTENISAVFPQTAAKREDGRGGHHHSGSSTNSTTSSNPHHHTTARSDLKGKEAPISGSPRDAAADKDDDVVSPAKDAANAEGDSEEEEKINLQRLFDAVSQQRSRNGKTTRAAAASSRRQRRGGRAAGGRRPEEAKPRRAASGSNSNSKGRAKASSTAAAAKGRKTARSAAAASPSSSSANRRKAKTSASSGGKQKSSSAKKRR
ncbi:putative mitochondrial hypothetical protein [Leptomonas pyrrhocoris]|uniref:Uncharacterized protein n=1 Tax=Leptomonas pyrrhocoris TaxID=157538 RepID=A0A0N0DSF5_LEPPY|nr:putative mitochondrial hypothetical protein [Leptomonas pyrrhocoris]KPA76012.1 putative mitochondrial hypothetical protein [Leptomonas pyrrhocoris]|eukprot:XP_015654451.1 putative mitochondrial hypothetical protein [Leptomonas pyrrhocoris]